MENTEVMALKRLKLKSGLSSKAPIQIQWTNVFKALKYNPWHIIGGQYIIVIIFKEVTFTLVIFSKLE